MALQLNGDGTITGLAEGGLENAKIIEDDIKDKAVGVPKLKDGTDGELITWNASGVADTIAVGTSGHYLKSNGAGAKPSWAAVSTDPTTTSGTNNFTVADGNLVIGTAGHGIDFSADAHATGKENELLDDYEEGTWTPALTYNGTAVGLDTPVGTYVKIGNFVCCRCRCKTTSNPDNGNVSISGLPFASSNPSNDGNAITGAMYMESADSNVTSGHPIAFGFDNSSQFDCRYSGQTGGGTNVADNCKTGTAFMTTISYQTA